ncbi:hypothetical protein JMJ35_009659 [Cladonia borealis]|uniref:Autophagy-related protein 16 domain-containing protein n=1 Tax=Cladonia borealis TaxID=184061 RepID=A0AA39QTH7_9LECA|nr:hypothetical protein JMJ35_009659 [Cladonia borealis]
MPSWRDEYSSALQQRDRREKSNQAFYDQYTKLADRTASLQSALASPPAKEDPTSSPKLKDRKASLDQATTRSTTPDAIAKVRQDLSEAQRSRGLMETKLQSVTEELKKLKIQSSLDRKKIGELTREKAILTTGLRDRDEELKGKTKLLEDVHDETVSLTLQLNMADEQAQKLQRENKELVDRWMARMGQEADAMNDKSKFS